MKAPTLDEFESPSMESTQPEFYSLGKWRAAREPIAPPDDPESSLFVKLTTCAFAGVLTALIIEIVVRVVLGR